MSNPAPSSKWYYGIIPVFVSLIVMGPFAFPLLWKSPQFNLFWKFLLTALVIVATIWTIKATAGIIDIVIQQFKQIQEAGLV